MRIPKHIGIIPDGNRRWALTKGLTKDKGYESGVDPGIQLLKLCEKEGIEEISYYGFTVDNTKRPKFQREAFTKSCVDAVKVLSEEDTAVLVVGNYNSPMFPKELLPFTTRKSFFKGSTKINLLVNYGWQWDLSNINSPTNNKSSSIYDELNSSDISRIDLVIRWGGRRRLSGFLPVQTVYSDFYIIDDYWPDFKEEHFYAALQWYAKQDVTLGG
ncbi:MAG: undecaprenyl diphosphate synthase family protein [Clostridiaceae bacterium]|nr:undecaprenyl diphosphate synthase family protein [Clostridiaceae bacterium]